MFEQFAARSFQVHFLSSAHTYSACILTHVDTYVTISRFGIPDLYLRRPMISYYTFFTPHGELYLVSSPFILFRGQFSGVLFHLYCSHTFRNRDRLIRAIAPTRRGNLHIALFIGIRAFPISLSKYKSHGGDVACLWILPLVDLPPHRFYYGKYCCGDIRLDFSRFNFLSQLYIFATGVDAITPTRLCYLFIFF